MKNIFVFLLLFVPLLFAQTEKSPWLQGERLTYRISWGIITAGEASLETKKTTGNKTEFYSLAHNNGAFKSIYPVADTIYSRIQNGSFLPEVFRKITHEGSYHNKSVIRFDRAGAKAWLSDTVFSDPIKRKIKRATDTTISIFGKERCIISAFYFVRGMDFVVGEKMTFSAVSGKKRYDLRVVIHGYEEINTKFGKKKCIKVEPILDGDGIFQASGRLFIWFTDDSKRLPVLMKSEIIVGSIKAELIDFSQK